MNNFRKMFVTVVMFALFILCACFVGNIETRYTRKGIVTNVCNNVVTIEDEFGEVWLIEDDTYNVNDKVTMRINTNHTNEIHDDFIEKVY